MSAQQPQQQQQQQQQSQPPIDFLILAVGTPGRDKEMTRRNAGYIFADYLANCISMQTTLLQKAQEGAEATVDSDTPEIPADFQRPVFVRVINSLHADVNDSIFSLTEADLTPPGEKKGSDAIVKKSFRVIIVKPHKLLSASNDDAINSLKYLFRVLALRDPAKQLIVAVDDMDTPRGTVKIQSGNDIASIKKHIALARVAAALNTADFIKFRLGIGKPKAKDDASIAKYLNGQFGTDGREIDWFGHTLDLTGQALQEYTAEQNITKLKAKYNGQKAANVELRQLPGVVFPVDLDVSIARDQIAKVLVDRGVLTPYTPEEVAEAEAAAAAATASASSE
ncbi:hypothetical protein BC831DRAFT_470617 [Entophlyctis helioformis]|nr:hypothetical protein BC831DRAFT_470617 [Entophlyctis helioformis]